MPQRKFAITVRGSGSRTILFGNGFGTTQGAWAEVIEGLAGAARCVTFDHAGATQATLDAYQPSRHGCLLGFAEDLVEVAESLAADGLVYVGHSVSGMVGLLAANAEPSLFARVVLVGASARYIDEPGTGYVGGFAAADVEALIAGMAGDYAAWANGFSTVAMDNPERPDLAAGFAASLRALRPELATRVFGAILRSDHRHDAEAYGTLGIPTLLLQTARDVAVPLPAAEWLAQATRGHLAVIDAAGHFPHIASPQAVLAELRSFLAPG